MPTPTTKQTIKVIREEIKNMLLEQVTPADLEKTGTGVTPRPTSKKPNSLTVSQIFAKFADQGIDADEIYKPYGTRQQLADLQRIKDTTLKGRSPGDRTLDQTTLDVGTGARQRFKDEELKAAESDATTYDCSQFRNNVGTIIFKGQFPVAASDPNFTKWLQNIRTGGKDFKKPSPTAKYGAHVSTQVDEAYMRLASKYNFLSPKALLQACKENVAYGGLGVDRDRFLVNIEGEYLLAKAETTAFTGDSELAQLITKMRAGLPNSKGLGTQRLGRHLRKTTGKSDPIEVYNLFYLEFFVGMAVRWDFYNVSLLPRDLVNELSPTIDNYQNSKDFAEQPRPGTVQVGKDRSVAVYRVNYGPDGDPVIPGATLYSNHAQGAPLAPMNAAPFRQGIDNTEELTNLVRTIDAVTTSRHEENKFRILPATDERLLASIKDPRESIITQRSDWEDRYSTSTRDPLTGLYSGRGGRGDYAGTLKRKTIYDPVTGQTRPAPPAAQSGAPGNFRDPSANKDVVPWFKRVSSKYYEEN